MSTLEIIKDLCAKRGTSITRLEKEMGYSNGSLSKVSKIPAERLLEIAKKFDVSVEYLITGEQQRDADGYYYNPETAKLAQEIFDNKDLGILMSASRKMSPEGLRQLALLIDTMVKRENGDVDT